MTGMQSYLDQHEGLEMRSGITSPFRLLGTQCILNSHRYSSTQILQKSWLNDREVLSSLPQDPPASEYMGDTTSSHPTPHKMAKAMRMRLLAQGLANRTRNFVF